MGHARAARARSLLYQHHSITPSLNLLLAAQAALVCRVSCSPRRNLCRNIPSPLLFLCPSHMRFLLCSSRALSLSSAGSACCWLLYCAAFACSRQLKLTKHAAPNFVTTCCAHRRLPQHAWPVPLYNTLTAATNCPLLRSLLLRGARLLPSQPAALARPTGRAQPQIGHRM